MGKKQKGNAFPSDPNSAIGRLVKEICAIGQRQGVNNAFTTYIEYLATGLAVNFDIPNSAKHQTRLDEIEKGMTPEENAQYAKLFALTYLAVKEFADDPVDILGRVFHELNLHSEWNGQFFSPDDICRLMACLSNINPSEDKNYATINDSACGSGAMLIAAAWDMRRKNIDHTKHMLAIAQDIDIRCVWMAYIQFCLYKIPAVVIHGNTLTNEKWATWHTQNYWTVVGRK